jgi:hypothetical protein
MCLLPVLRQELQLYVLSNFLAWFLAKSEITSQLKKLMIMLLVPDSKKCRALNFKEPYLSSFRYAITVDNRLARVEEDVQKLIPMAKAFETWLRTNDSSLPFVHPTFFWTSSP